MATNTNLNIRIDRELKENADAFFSSLGISTSSAVTLFMRQCLREQRIPFDLRLVPTVTDIDATPASIDDSLIIKSSTPEII